MSVTSCTIHPDPDKSREMYICTRFSGLYRCDDISNSVNPDGTIVASLVAEYPFRAPIRVFFVPIDDAGSDHDVWVTSNGNGIHLLSSGAGAVRFDLGDGIWARIEGKELVDRDDAEYSTYDARALDDAVERVMSQVAPQLRHGTAGDRLRALIRIQIRARLAVATR